MPEDVRNALMAAVVVGLILFVAFYSRKNAS